MDNAYIKWYKSVTSSEDSGVSEDVMTHTILETIHKLGNGARNKGGRQVITEEAEKSKKKHTEEAEKSKKKHKGIAITNAPLYGDNVLQNQIDNFRSAVSGAAEFAEPDESKVEECPLIYIPDTGNLIFSGTIPEMNNLEFQFVLKTSTGNGCFVWSDGLILSKENMKTLIKLQGFYENWKEEWLTASKELESLKNIK